MLTDIEEKVPFDLTLTASIYQTFYGMPDILGPLLKLRPSCLSLSQAFFRAAYDRGSLSSFGAEAVWAYNTKTPSSRRAVC
jgi:hypothetical protein